MKYIKVTPTTWVEFDGETPLRIIDKSALESRVIELNKMLHDVPTTDADKIAWCEINYPNSWEMQDNIRLNNEKEEISNLLSKLL